MLVDSILGESTKTTLTVGCVFLLVLLDDMVFTTEWVKRVVPPCVLIIGVIVRLCIMPTFGFFCMKFGCFVIYYVAFTFYTVFYKV